MCGIIGYIGKEAAVPILIEGLKKLEYRGYDSAGVAVLQEGRLEVRRAVGKLQNLETVLRGETLSGRCGVGHVRWATHGRPSEENAHPHRAGSVVSAVAVSYVAARRVLRIDLGKDVEAGLKALAQAIEEALQPEAMR